MEEFLKKLEIFDFMGVWIPGATILLYLVLTINYACPSTVETFQKITFYHSSLLSIVLILAGYLTGIVLHEIGKIIKEFYIDRKNRTLSIDTYNRYFETYGIDMSAHIRVHQKLIPVMPYYRERKKLYLDIKNIMPDYQDKTLTIYDAMQYLREKQQDLTRVNKTRSLHGYARSVCIGFVIHLFATIPMMIVAKRILIMPVVLDLSLMVLFWNRSCRYYFEWIKKVIFQYDSFIKGCNNHESEQTAKTDL